MFVSSPPCEGCQWLSSGQLSDQQSSPWLCSLVNQTETILKTQESFAGVSSWLACHHILIGWDLFFVWYVFSQLKANLLWSYMFVCNTNVQYMIFTVMRIYISVSFPHIPPFLKTTQERPLTSDIVVRFPHLIWNSLMKNVDRTASTLSETERVN